MLKLKIVHTLHAQITSKNTGKRYTRSMAYTKRVVTGELKGERKSTYYLREGKGWKEISEKEFNVAMSDSEQTKVCNKLNAELYERFRKLEEQHLEKWK